MARTYHAGAHSEQVWESVAGTLEQIEGLVFLSGMLDGSLEPRRFVNYILQDGIYLEGYARSMSVLAAKAGDTEESSFWHTSSVGAIADEKAMQADLLGDERFAALAVELAPGGIAEPSPTTLGYTSYLTAAAFNEPYEVGVAAILPCFWVYAHVGRVLTQRAGGALENNPYATWVAMYDSEEFGDAAARAAAIYERCAAGTTDEVRARMETAFQRATCYELLFWARAGELEGWTV